MRSLLVVDAPVRWRILAGLLADLGDVTIACGNEQEVPKTTHAPAIVSLPADPSGWKKILTDTETIVHVGSSSQLAALVEALASACARPQVLVAIASIASDAPAVELVAGRAARPGFRVCCARVGAWVGEDSGLIRALVPLYRCFAGLRQQADDRPISWCHHYDVARGVVFAVQSPEIAGPFDLVTPEPSRVQDLDLAICDALRHRPALRVSISTASRLVGQRLGQELAFGSERFPEELARRGFAFVFPDIRSAVRDVLADRRSDRSSGR